MDKAIRANVTISTLDARGVYVIIPGGDASTPGGVSGGGLKAQYAIATANANQDILAELAAATGGSVLSQQQRSRGRLQANRHAARIHLRARILSAESEVRRQCPCAENQPDEGRHEERPRSSIAGAPRLLCAAPRDRSGWSRRSRKWRRRSSRATRSAICRSY